MEQYKCIEKPADSKLVTGKIYFLKINGGDISYVSVTVNDNKDNELYSFSFRPLYANDEFHRYFKHINEYRQDLISNVLD